MVKFVVCLTSFAGETLGIRWDGLSSSRWAMGWASGKFFWTLGRRNQYWASTGLFMFPSPFSLCRGENAKWADPLLISLPGLCFGGNRQRLLRHFRRLKHEPVREKMAKNVFAGVFTQIESILFSSENRYRIANRTISMLYFPCMRTGINRQKFVVLFCSRLV